MAKAIFAQQAGAAVAVMTNNAAGLPPVEGPITSNPDTGVPFIVTIPFAGVAGNQATATTDSGKLQASPVGTTASLSVQNFAESRLHWPSPRSLPADRGRVTARLKPDITAPGVSIFSTASGTGNGGKFLSGTSMASPHVAGVAALTRQAHPTWKVEDIKAAIVNTGLPSGVRTTGRAAAARASCSRSQSTKSQVTALADGHEVPGGRQLRVRGAEGRLQQEEEDQAAQQRLDRRDVQRRAGDAVGVAAYDQPQQDGRHRAGATRTRTST